MRDIELLSALTQAEIERSRMYGLRIMGQNPAAFGEFLAAVHLYQQEGEFFEGERRTPTIEEVSLATDKSGYPMFPEEVQELLEDLRDKMGYPEYLHSVTFRGIKCDLLLTFHEMVAFCIYMESKHAGSGLYTYGVRKNNES